MLYTFQAVSPPFIRSSKTTHSIWYMSSLLAATTSKVRQGRDTDPSPPSSAEIKNIVELYLNSP